MAEHLQRGTIRAGKGLYAVSFFFVKKADRKLQPVQDYRPLNKYTKKNRNMSPLIPQVINRLAGCTLFTKFDIRWGYNNIRIKEGDEWKAAFVTSGFDVSLNSQVKFEVLGFGACSGCPSYKYRLGH